MNIAENASVISGRKDDAETLVPLAQIDVNGTSHRTIWGWATTGVDGVVLKSIKVGRRLYTTRSNVADFLLKVNQRRATSTRY